MTQAIKEFPSPLTLYFLVTVELIHLTLGDKEIEEGLSLDHSWLYFEFQKPNVTQISPSSFHYPLL